MRIGLIIIFSLMSACGNQSGMMVKPSVKPSANILINPSALPVASMAVVSSKPEDIKPSLSPEVKPSVVVHPDNSLVSKINDVVIPSPTPTVTPISGSSGSGSSSTSNSGSSSSESPIKPEDRGQGQPAKPCDGYGVNSQQCQTYLESQKPPKPSYSRVEPIPDGLTSGHIEMTFKDEYKIRYRKEQNKFISLTGADVLSINQILISDKIPGLYQSDISEEKAEEYEKLESESCGCDARNSLSFLSFGVKEVNLTEFVMKLRNNPFVREANVFNGSNGAG